MAPVFYFAAVDHTIHHLNFVVTTKMALVGFSPFCLHFLCSCTYFLLSFGPFKLVYCIVFNRMGLVEMGIFVGVYTMIWVLCAKKGTKHKSITSLLTWAKTEAHTCFRSSINWIFDFHVKHIGFVSTEEISNFSWFLVMDITWHHVGTLSQSKYYSTESNTR